MYVRAGLTRYDKYRVVTFKIDPKLLSILDREALRQGRSRSEVIREALSMYIRVVNGKLESKMDK